MEAIHVMFYIEVYKVALGPSVYMNHMPPGIIGKKIRALLHTCL